MRIIKEEWEMLDIKSVPDYDGFYTDYTLYANNDHSRFICIFGDKDIYKPDEESPDFETDNYDEAIEWFEDFKGADE